MFDLKRWISGTLMTGLICHGLQATAETGASIPSIIGQESRIEAKFEDTFADLADTYKLGFNELIAANPGMDPWLPTPEPTSSCRDAIFCLQVPEMAF